MRLRPGKLTREFLPELVYGANDGIITTYAIIAGVAGARLSTEIVLILGVANLLADGVSMGASRYLSARSEFRGGVRTAQRPSSRFALATFVGFQLGGVIPLLAYLLPFIPFEGFAAASVLTALALFGVGAARSLVTEIGPWEGGLEMLLIGSFAAGVAYGTAMLGRQILSQGTSAT